MLEKYRFLTAGLAVCALAFIPTSANAAPVSSQLPAPFQGPLTVALSINHANQATHDAPPSGANDWHCRPTAQHPLPVVLVHGSRTNAAVNWDSLSPLLKNAGYCVFALNYGRVTNGGILVGEDVGGVADIRISGKQLSDFVQKVLRATGAQKVDMIGHSQGGLVGRYYTTHLDGGQSVSQLIGISSSTRGTSALGLARIPGTVKPMQSFITPFGYALRQQVRGSDFLQEINAGKLVDPRVQYTIIATNKDEVVTPYTSQFLPGANNITLQDTCPTNFTDHFAIVYNPQALNTVLASLDNHYRGTVPCVLSMPFIGG